MTAGLAGVLALFLAAGPLASRTLEVRITVDAPLEAGARNLRLWLPVPSSGALQTVQDLRWEAAWKGSLRTEKEYRNRYLYFEAERPKAGPLTVTFNVERKAAGKEARDTRAGDQGRWLQADRLVPLSGAVADEAERAAKRAPRGLARSLYDRVVGTMRYDKTQPGWGRGDALRACDVRTGNCTDFHSLFIGMARAKKIPARFTMGFSVPKGRAGEIPGYHCWAEYWDEKAGAWIPVDASEASKHPEKKDYFFGNLDDDRFEVSRGRDVELSPRPRSGRQNYLLHPILELDGEAVELPMKVEYKELS